jgi:hypothetical protein
MDFLEKLISFLELLFWKAFEKDLIKYLSVPFALLFLIAVATKFMKDDFKKIANFLLVSLGIVWIIAVWTTINPIYDQVNTYLSLKLCLNPYILGEHSGKIGFKTLKLCLNPYILGARTGKSDEHNGKIGFKTRKLCLNPYILGARTGKSDEHNGKIGFKTHT